MDVSLPFADFEVLRSHLSSFEQIAAYARDGFTVRGLTEPRFLATAVVDDMFFETLGSPALAGRTFGPGDAAAVVVLSERVARQSSASMESLQGRRITVGEIAATVIGVMPDAFAFPSQGTDAGFLHERHRGLSSTGPATRADFTCSDG